MTTTASDSVKKFTMTPRQKLLMPVVVLGAFFEGFDFMVINQTLPFITRDFKVTDQTAAYVLSIIAIGTLVAFFLVRTADRLGRRPIFISAIVGYSIMSLITAFAHDLTLFVICQFIGRIFLVTSWAIGFLYMTEEFAPEIRGRAIGLFQSAAAVGAIFPAALLPVAAMTPLHWRALFILGALPLLVLIFLQKNLPETQRFIDLKNGLLDKIAQPGPFAVFEKRFRKHILAIMALWFFMYLCYSSSMNFFSQHVVSELGWDEARVGMVNAIAYLLGLSGYLAVGKLLDSIGRKKTAYLFFSMGALAAVATYQTTEFAHILIAQTIAVFFLGTFTVMSATFTNELFPTAIRANATAWSNNIVGRIGQIAAPALVGLLQIPLHGIGNAVSVLALAPFVCVAIIALFLPEPLTYKVPEYTPPTPV